MSTAISVLGGVGLFLLGMSVMTSGLKAVAGSRLRATLSTVAATPFIGRVLGCFRDAHRAVVEWIGRKKSLRERQPSKP